MSQAIVTTVISAVIAGVFTLIGKRMELSSGRVVARGPSAPGDITQPARVAIDYGRVLIHIGIVQLVGNIVGAFLGVLIGPYPAVLIPSILIVGTAAVGAVFFWMAASVDRTVRWKHFSLVSVGVAITTVIINSIFLQIPLSLGLLAFAFAQTFLAMGIGVGLANRGGR